MGWMGRWSNGPVVTQGLSCRDLDEFGALSNRGPFCF